MDFDHVIDYVRCTGWNLNIKYFFQFSYEAHYERLTILFHAWELSAFFVLMIMATGGNLLVLAVGIGLIQHLVFDQCFNPVKPLAYFITYRLKHKFRKESILRDEFLASLPRDYTIRQSSRK